MGGEALADAGSTEESSGRPAGSARSTCCASTAVPLSGHASLGGVAVERGGEGGVGPGVGTDVDREMPRRPCTAAEGPASAAAMSRTAVESTEEGQDGSGREGCREMEVGGDAFERGLGRCGG